MRLALLSSIVLCIGCFPDPGQPGYFVVDHPTPRTVDEPDVAPGDGICRTASGGCSLLAAIMESNALPGPQTIELPADGYNLKRSLVVTDDVLIAGAGANATGISTGERIHAFTVTSGSLWLLDVAVSGLRGAVAVRSGADAVLIRTVITGDGAFQINGALSVAGRLLLDESTITGGESGVGAAIYGEPGSVVVVNRSTVADTLAFGSSDTQGLGGAIYNAGELYVSDSTISGNRGTGAIANAGTAHLSSVTITDNSSDRPFSTGLAGGISNLGTLSMRDTIVAGNHGANGAPADCVGTLDSHGHNLVGDATSCMLVGSMADLVGLAPGLSPLADNGGPTRTHALMSDSPAVDAGSHFCEPVDQRGVRRPQGPACDIGAYERTKGGHITPAPKRLGTPRSRIPECHELLPPALWSVCPPAL